MQWLSQILVSDVGGVWPPTSESFQIDLSVRQDHADSVKSLSSHHSKLALRILMTYDWFDWFVSFFSLPETPASVLRCSVLLTFKPPEERSVSDPLYLCHNSYGGISRKSLISQCVSQRLALNRVWTAVCLSGSSHDSELCLTSPCELQLCVKLKKLDMKSQNRYIPKHNIISCRLEMTRFLVVSTKPIFSKELWFSTLLSSTVCGSVVLYIQVNCIKYSWKMKAVDSSCQHVTWPSDLHNFFILIDRIAFLLWSLSNYISTDPLLDENPFVIPWQ